MEKSNDKCVHALENLRDGIQNLTLFLNLEQGMTGFFKDGGVNMKKGCQPYVKRLKMFKLPRGSKKLKDSFLEKYLVWIIAECKVG